MRAARLAAATLSLAQTAPSSAAMWSAFGLAYAAGTTGDEYPIRQADFGSLQKPRQHHRFNEVDAILSVERDVAVEIGQRFLAIRKERFAWGRPHSLDQAQIRHVGGADLRIDHVETSGQGIGHRRPQG